MSTQANGPIGRLSQSRESRAHAPFGRGSRRDPAGRLRYLDSRIVDDVRLDRCFQLTETDEPILLDRWRERWSDLAEFDVFPVIESDRAAARVGVVWERGAQG